MGKFERYAIKVNKYALLEYECLKKWFIFYNKKKHYFKRYSYSHNVRSLSKYVDDIASDNRIMKNYITGFTESNTNQFI